jgi:hypothetical protein
MKKSSNGLQFEHVLSEKATLPLFQTERVRSGERLNFFSSENSSTHSKKTFGFK